tara:strand:- start:49541 stop:49996 length:456 start_codon:yes stop_codon:yes gene_type:complete
MSDNSGKELLVVLGIGGLAFCGYGLIAFCDSRRSLARKVQKIYETIEGDEKDEFNLNFNIPRYCYTRSEVLNFFDTRNLLTEFITKNVENLRHCPDLEVVVQHFKVIKRISPKHYMFKAFTLECEEYDVLMYYAKNYILHHNSTPDNTMTD